MKLVKFRIRHYKSIVDSGDCYLAEDCTTLIGKNESGKTAFLEALRDFDRDQKKIAPEAYSMASISEDPTLELHFTLSQEEISAIETESGVEIAEDLKRKICKDGICFIKTACGEYQLGGEYRDLADGLSSTEETVEDIEVVDVKVELSETKPEDKTTLLIGLKQEIDDLLKGMETPDLILDQGDAALEGSVRVLVRRVKSHLGLISSDQVKCEKVVELLRSIIKKSANSPEPSKPKVQEPVPAPIQKEEDPFSGNIIDCLVRRLPRFVLFSDFTDILPFDIAINDLENNKSVRDFARISNLNLEDVVKTTDLQRRMNLLSRYSAKISGDFLEHWGQSDMNLEACLQGERLLFGIKEKDNTDFFKVEQRSKGFQWFLSFYLCINGYDTNNMVLLIDEPGVSLHPLAQKDILNILKKKSAQGIQVIFSTHSSSLLDIDQLSSIRCIVKEKGSGSRVFNELNNDLDEDTLIPVRMAIGFSVSQNVSVIGDKVETRIDSEDVQIESETDSALDKEEKESSDELEEVSLDLELKETEKETLCEEEDSIKKNTPEENEESKEDEEPPAIKKRRSIFNMFR